MLGHQRFGGDQLERPPALHRGWRKNVGESLTISFILYSYLASDHVFLTSLISFSLLSISGQKMYDFRNAHQNCFIFYSTFYFLSFFFEEVFVFVQMYETLSCNATIMHCKAKSGH